MHERDELTQENHNWTSRQSALSSKVPVFWTNNGYVESWGVTRASHNSL